MPSWAFNICNLNSGITSAAADNKTFGAAKLKKQAQLQTLDLDYIFVDEVSMLGEVFYKLLMMIKKLRPNIKFIKISLNFLSNFVGKIIDFWHY